MAIIYDYFGGLYINLTNKCPNRCKFCIRNYTDALVDADSLVLDEDPTVEQVEDELKKWDMDEYIEEVRKYVPQVAVSVVRGTLSQEALEKCRSKASELGVDFRVR
ncbi:MAG: hypothetical protein ACOX4R_07860 [Lentihominibacter sp.]|jgi:hypothetical protein